MKQEILFVFICDNCGHEMRIENGDELNDYLNDDCTFCIDGNYKTMVLFINHKEINLEG